MEFGKIYAFKSRRNDEKNERKFEIQIYNKTFNRWNEHENYDGI